MSKSILQYILITAVLVLAQVLICNHIMIFNVATLFIFIYVIINLPLSLPTGWLLTWAFLSGLIVDIFSDTLGVNALACTVLAMVKKPVFYAYIPKDDRTKDILPSLSSLGFSVYAKYLLSMTAIYCLLVFSIEYMSIADIKEIAIMSAGSALFTFLILIGLDSLLDRKN
ncbi:MAG: rod shape-determining protein MreD [Muribaculaceae bacterium]|nr:rod shape-determining protein MreD [Muribaculaceae bacterium]